MNNYVVQKGDTLYGISKRFNTSVQSLKELNNLKDNIINVGETLIISNNNESNPLECIVYTVKKGDTLYSISKKYNTTVDEIKRYNNLSSNILNIGDRIIIPCNVSNDYKDLNNNYVNYIVVKGDSLYSIANKFKTTVDKIKELNDLKTNILNIGQKLIIDDRSGVSSILECFGESDYNNQKYQNYMVVKGDNLYDLAKKFNTSIDQIKLLNNLKDNNLSIGQVLKMPKSSNTYVVQKGESLYSIAKKFNTTVDSIKKKNNLTSNLIRVGEELII